MLLIALMQSIYKIAAFYSQYISISYQTSPPSPLNEKVEISFVILQEHISLKNHNFK